MIDIHAHILPGIDDGSSSPEESLKMLHVAAADGVKAIVVTPHVFHVGEYTDFGETKRRDYQLRFKELKKGAKDQNIEMEILPGAEVFFMTDLREKLASFRDVLTINNSDYFLLEFPPDMVYYNSKEYIFDLVTDGFIPIICHPERNLEIQHNPQRLFQLLQAGSLVQVDAGSIRGDFGPTVYSTSINLLKHNLVHVIASDCHDAGNRIPGLSFVYKKLPIIEKEKIDMLVERIPLAIVNNNAIPDTGPMIDPGKSTTFFDMIRRVIK